MGKVRPDDPAKLTDFKLLSFDVYSTLVDELGVFTISFVYASAYHSASTIRHLRKSKLGRRTSTSTRDASPTSAMILVVDFG